MKELGLFIIKPDAILQREIEPAKKRIEQAGLTILKEQEVKFTRQQVLDFYGGTGYNIEETWFGYLTQMSSHALIIEGEKTSVKLSEIKKQMRNEFPHDSMYTGHHCSDNEEDAKREIEILGLI